MFSELKRFDLTEKTTLILFPPKSGESKACTSFSLDTSLSLIVLIINVQLLALEEPLSFEIDIWISISSPI